MPQWGKLRIRQFLLLLCAMFVALTFAPSGRAQASHTQYCAHLLQEPALDPWIRDLIHGYSNEASLVPESFQHRTFWTRVKNEVFLRSARIYLTYFADLKPNQSIEQIPDSASKIHYFLRQIDNSPLGWVLRGSIFQRLIGLTEAKEPSHTAVLGTILEKIRTFQSQFKDDIERYEQIYGSEFFTPEVLARATINTQTMKLFALVQGIETIPSRDAANAIALLHPVTDEALDKGTVSKSSIEKLSELLENQTPPSIKTPYEKILFGLLEYISRDFPPAQHPWLHSMLKQLHFAQLRSLMQKGEISDEDLLYLTFEKGGLSTAIAGYIALGGLTSKQYEFFFKAGAVFQLMDDLLDIETDLQEGGRTVWTGPIKKQASLLPPLNRFLAVQSHLESQLDDLISDFGPNTSFGDIYRFGFKLTLMRGLSRNAHYFKRSELAWLKPYFPISLQTLRDFFRFTSSYNKIVPQDIAEIIRASEAY